MNIAFFGVDKGEEGFIEQKLVGHQLSFFEDDLDERTASLALDAQVVCVFIDSDVNRSVLVKLKGLRAVVTRSTGFDHIDVKFCKKKKIRVYNVPHYGENTVAEHTFALILSLSRKINQSIERTMRGNFSLDGLQGFDLKEKTIGIIGMGSIGSHVARMAKGFEMKVLAHSKHRDQKLAKRLGFTYTTLNKLLKDSDIITLHVPHNKKTHHLINGRNIHSIKKGAYIVNTSRGGLINTKALIRALAKGKIGGAALDVLEEEQLIKEEIEMFSRNFPKETLENLLENHILLTFNNVIITPHNAFNSKEALERIRDTTLQNIICAIKNKSCGSLVV